MRRQRSGKGLLLLLVSIIAVPALVVKIVAVAVAVALLEHAVGSSNECRIARGCRLDDVLDKLNLLNRGGPAAGVRLGNNAAVASKVVVGFSLIRPASGRAWWRAHTGSDKAVVTAAAAAYSTTASVGRRRRRRDITCKPAAAADTTACIASAGGATTSYPASTAGVTSAVVGSVGPSAEILHGVKVRL